MEQGKYIRDNSLGLLKLNGLLHTERPDKSILLASRNEAHNFYRPYLDHTVGPKVAS